MEKIVIASVGKGAGKTSLIIGMASVLKKPIGYLKPFGDRMVYREKKVWDYDAHLVTNLFGPKRDPEEMTIGFEHVKLRYMYTEEGKRQKLLEMISRFGEDLLFIEGGKDLRYGVSVGLDPLSLARDTDGKLVILLDGNEDSLMDDALFVKKNLSLAGLSYKGVIFNKVRNMEEFKTFYLKKITDMGIPVLGVIPYEKELSYLSVSYLAKQLFAKVITGENALNRVAKNILVGAMSVDALFQTSLFQKEEKLVITSGDRTDMILAAIEQDAACLVITNNIVPPSNILCKAAERNIPMLLVSQDTYQVAMQINNLEPLMTRGDCQKASALKQLIESNVDMNAIL